MKQNNILAIIVWFLGLLGFTGFLNEFGFFALLIPILFWLLGNKFTKNHCKAYFNVLITTVVLYFLGVILEEVTSWFTSSFYNLKIVSIIYFGLMVVIGLIAALKNKRYKPLLSLNILK